MAGQTFAALMLMLASTTVPADVTPTAPGDTETLATATDIAERMTVETHVNGQGPFAFTIDTGADRSVVSDRLAGTLDLPAGRAAQVFGITGLLSVATVELDRLRVGTREQRSVSAPVLPERSLGAVGFLGIDALKDQRVLLDFKRRRITIARSAQEAMADDPDVIVVTGRSKFGQLILTDAKIGNTKVYAIIDTGAQNTIGNLALRRMLKKSSAPGQPGEVIGVTGVVLPAELSFVSRIKLGGLELANMPIAYADVQTFRLFGLADRPAILVGMDVLRGFERVAIDFKTHEVRFRVGNGSIGRI